jgi:hypothetical protein
MSLSPAEGALEARFLAQHSAATSSWAGLYQTIFSLHQDPQTLSLSCQQTGAELAWIRAKLVRAEGLEPSWAV